MPGLRLGGSAYHARACVYTKAKITQTLGLFSGPSFSKASGAHAVKRIGFRKISTRYFRRETHRSAFAPFPHFVEKIRLEVRPWRTALPGVLYGMLVSVTRAWAKFYSAYT